MQKYSKKYSKIFEKCIFQAIGFRRIMPFPIACTPLLKTIFQKKYFLKILEAQRKNTLKFFEKKVFFRLLDLCGRIFEDHFPKKNFVIFFQRPKVATQKFQKNQISGFWI